MTTMLIACQSCGMPMPESVLYGTKLNGELTSEFCKYCYENGAFTQPDLTVEGMVELCTSILVEEGKEEPSARAMLQAYLPSLKRWSTGIAADTAGGPDRIVEHSGLRLAGLSARTTNRREASPDGAIPQLWSRFWSGPGGQLAAASAEPGVVYGLYYDYEDGADGEYSVLAGVSADAGGGGECPLSSKELDNVVVPTGKYAVFVTRRGPSVQVVVEAWQRIWRWAASPTGYERTFTGDFERYDERCHNPDDAVVEIFIAIKA